MRKPFLLVGGLGFAVPDDPCSSASSADPATSYGTLRALLIGMAAFQSVLYVPWMAAFTETVEDIHPSLVATGLAVWGWIVRIVICATFLALPHIVSGVSTLVEAPPAAALQAQGAKLKAEQTQLEREAATLAPGGVAAAGRLAEAARRGVPDEGGRAEGDGDRRAQGLADLAVAVRGRPAAVHPAGAAAARPLEPAPPPRPTSAVTTSRSTARWRGSRALT